MFYFLGDGRGKVEGGLGCEAEVACLSMRNSYLCK